jgi:ATP-dependent Clp protease ATP-binding subunit ClpC
LAHARDAIEARLTGPEWAAEKLRLSAAMSEARFWSRPERFATLGRIELMDRIEVAADTARSLEGRLARRTGSGPAAREPVARLALQLHLIAAGLADLDANAPDEAALLVEPAFEKGSADGAAAIAWAGEIGAMYRAWAKRRNMRTAEVDGLPNPSQPMLLVAGFGAYRTLNREAGLHVLENGEGATPRIAVRVLVVASPAGNLSKAEFRKALAAAFAALPRTGVIQRRYRREPSPLVRNADGSWRSGKVEDVLAGDFDLLASDHANPS